MNEIKTEAPPVPVRRCNMDEVFASPFIELIGLAPQNPVVRGLILAQTGRMPGPERLTFEAIKEWVELTCDKQRRSPRQPVARAREGINITVEFSETECGSARYTVPRCGSAEFALEAEELVDLVQTAVDKGDDLDELVEAIGQRIDDNAWEQCEPDMDNTGDYDYKDYECNSTDDLNVEYSKTQVKERLLGFLRERHPQLLEELV